MMMVVPVLLRRKAHLLIRYLPANHVSTLDRPPLILRRLFRVVADPGACARSPTPAIDNTAIFQSALPGFVSRSAHWRMEAPSLCSAALFTHTLSSPKPVA
jgi:hypothetical protein